MVMRVLSRFRTRLSLVLAGYRLPPLCDVELCRCLVLLCSPGVITCYFSSLEDNSNTGVLLSGEFILAQHIGGKVTTRISV